MVKRFRTGGSALTACEEERIFIHEREDGGTVAVYVMGPGGPELVLAYTDNPGRLYTFRWGHWEQYLEGLERQVQTEQADAERARFEPVDHRDLFCDADPRGGEPGRETP